MASGSALLIRGILIWSQPWCQPDPIRSAKSRTDVRGWKCPRLDHGLTTRGHDCRAQYQPGLALPIEAKSRSGLGSPPGTESAPDGNVGRSRWHSEVGHSAIDVVVAEGREVQRDCRFLEGDHPVGGDVEATADAISVAAARAGQAAQGQVQQDIRLIE
jgi:hypothetical protein